MDLARLFRLYRVAEQRGDRVALAGIAIRIRRLLGV